MGGPVGGPLRQLPANDNQRSQLNTYIYDYFLRHGMYDCARALLNSDPTMKVIKESPGRRRDDNGNEEGEDVDSKDDIDSKRPEDLPRSDVPRECPESCFLYEWWCLFWDMFNAQRGKGEGINVRNYVNHTNAQSRMRQEQQQNMLRGIARGEMMPAAQYQQMMRMNQQANGMNLNQNELRHKAIQNSNRNATPQQMMLAKQQQQQAMQRDPSSGDHQQRSGSPGSADNAPSPSKRARLDGAANFNPQQIQNGRGQPMPQQFQNMPGAANAQQARSLAGYQAGLAQQQAGQMPVKGMPNPGPANQGSPMMNQGQDGGAIAGYYNAGEMGPNGMRGGAPGQQAAGGGNHALQDYQMQLMLLEQQNKKRLMMARQEQDSMAIPGQGRDGSGAPLGPNGQPFQQGTSPQGTRSVNSPNPSDQMKRGTPHMNPAGIPSPMPEGQSRGSPSGMNFNMPGAQMDPNMSQQYFMKNGMDPTMGMPNGMRPPSSHPAGGFNAQGMAANQMVMNQAPRQPSVNGTWQNGPNGQMIPGPAQGGPQQVMGQGTPQPRPMAPPAAPAAPNGRTQPSSPQQNAAPPTPQQSNKANPKKKNDAKETKAKRATKKGTAATTGATPSADSVQEPATPTPATPITPVHPKSFNGGQNGAVQPNGQPPAPMNNGVPQQPDPLANNFVMGDPNAFDLNSFEFANNGPDVLQDFDFDSFLHQDGEGVDNFNFDASGFLDSGEIGTE